MSANRFKATSMLIAAGAAATLLWAPNALADDTIACAPGQVVIDGNCNVAPQDDMAPPASDFFAPAPMDNGGGDNVDIGTGGVDIATGGVDIGGGGVNVGGGGETGGGGHR